MPHAQQQVLEAVRSAIVAGGTAAGARVYLDRVDPVQAHELPAVLVDESADGETTAAGQDIGPIYTRQLALRITCVVADGSGARPQARDLGLQVEKALAPGGPVDAVAKGGLVLQNSRPLEDPAADRLLAAREQSWTVTYFTHAAAPDVLI